MAPVIFATFEMAGLCLSATMLASIESQQGLIFLLCNEQDRPTIFQSTPRLPFSLAGATPPHTQEQSSRVL